MNAIQLHGNQVVLTIHVTPRASKDEVRGFHGNAIKIRLRAPPVEGKANRELIRFLSRKLDIPARQIALLTGKSGRHKRVSVAGLSISEVSKRLDIPN